MVGMISKKEKMLLTAEIVTFEPAGTGILSEMLKVSCCVEEVEDIWSLHCDNLSETIYTHLVEVSAACQLR
jgi:hypothetical protein